MNMTLLALGLAGRICLAWWLEVLFLCSIFGGDLGLGIGCFSFPIAVGLGVLGSLFQFRSYQGLPLAHSLGAFHQAIIQVPMAVADVETVLAGLFQENLAATHFSLRAHCIQAEFRPPEWSGWWRKWVLSDEMSVEISPSETKDGEESGCMLKVTAGPLSRYIYGFLWIDRARNYRRLQHFQQLLGERTAESNRRKEMAWKSDSLESRLAQAELLLLRAQVEPHFLFNTLAHLRELIRINDGPTALAMLDHLIAYTRSVSNRIRQSTHRLDQELETSLGYLSLMQLRFGDRLTFDAHVASEIQDCEVPVGCLLIPIENAIKHGIEPNRAQGTVTVRAKLEDESLILEVLDDGPGLPKDPDAACGTGLLNLRERLRLLFAEKASMIVEDQEEGGVRVQVSMPARRSVAK